MKTKLLLVVALLGCATAPQAQQLASAPTARVAETPSVSIIEDPKYEQWYHELEKCSGLKGDFNRLTIYETHDRLHLGRTFDGYWEPGSIVVRHRWEKVAVQHEMMHDLTNSNRHPRSYFKGACGDLMRGELPD